MAGPPVTLALEVEVAFFRSTIGLFALASYYMYSTRMASENAVMRNFLTWCPHFVLVSDTQKFAFKCSFITYADETGELQDREVFKSPIDQPMKKSKKGRLTLHKLDGSQGEKVDAVLAADNDTATYVDPACRNSEAPRCAYAYAAGLSMVKTLFSRAMYASYVRYIKEACAIDNGYVTMQNGLGDPATDRLQCIFENGELKVDSTLAEIRDRANVSYEEAAALDLDSLLTKLQLK